MTVKNIICLIATICIGLSGFSATALAEEKDYTKPQELVDRSVTVVKRFEADPNLETFKSLITRAKGVFIVPQMLKGGFFIGGSGGSGALLTKNEKTGQWSYPVFYTMGAVSFGLQIGAESSRIILLVMTEKGMDSMLSTSFKLGAEASVAAGPVGGGAKAATADILSYMQSKGAYTGVAIDGAVIKIRDGWNATYYGQKVSPADIFIREAVSNPAADPLRQAVAELAATQG